MRRSHATSTSLLYTGLNHAVTTSFMLCPVSTFLSGQHRQQTSQMTHNVSQLSQQSVTITLQTWSIIDGLCDVPQGLSVLSVCPSIKKFYFRTVSAKSSQPHIANDIHTAINGDSCWGNSATYGHSVGSRSSFLLTADVLIVYISRIFAISYRFALRSLKRRHKVATRRKNCWTIWQNHWDNLISTYWPLHRHFFH